MKIHIVLLLSCFILITKVIAQQTPEYTQYMYNMSVINPAYVGINKGVSLGFLAKTQWAGVNGAPKSINAFIHSKVGKNIGLGLFLIHDKTGPVTETHSYADFSVTIKPSKKSKLSFGLKAGATFQQIGLLKLNQTDPNDPKFNQNVNKTYPNFGIGVLYYLEKFYLGLSIPNILESLHFERSNGVIVRASQKTNGFLTTGYVFNLKKYFKLKPSILTRYNNSSPILIDMSLNLLWKNKFELGVSHRFNNSWSGVVNLKATNNLRVGYGYNHVISNFSRFNSGSHEVLLLFNFQENPTLNRFF
ncbi:PorP/SprF family type IX secretion system membrane protein [Tenacibaculum soleae]|uniref:PorP/SprF family type IX secretion system membrane protein n=1 Tax=Tenacibaculum soleae TaxID=447689 RepID=UPI0022FFDB37|nr:type IX secretion system membrane protein PorP/SprF [Tenacibaculum soleae]